MYFRTCNCQPPTKIGPKSVQVEDFCKKGAKVEVLAPSNRWREAQVVRVGGGVARIHYTGYDAQFDEEVPLDNQRLRPFGQIRREKLKERKEDFVLQLDAGCCPGCGVKLQCTDKMALGPTCDKLCSKSCT